MTQRRRVLVVGSSCEVLGHLLRRLIEQGDEVESAFDDALEGRYGRQPSSRSG